MLLLSWYALRLPIEIGWFSALWSTMHDCVVGVLVVAAFPVLIRVLLTRGSWFRDVPLLYLALCMVSVVSLLAIPTLGFPYVRMQWITLVTFAALYLCSYAVARREPRVILLLITVWGSWAVTSAAREIFMAIARRGLLHDVVDPMGHANSRAGYELLITLFLLGVVFAGTRRQRFACAPLLVLFLVSLGLSLSRGAWLGLLAAATLGVGLRWGWWRALGLCAAVVLALAVVPGSLGLRARSVVDAGFATNAFRLTTWRTALQLIWENPWRGSGYDTLWFAMLTHLGSETATLAGRHVHNLLLQTWAEAGLLGAVALVGTWVGAVRSASRLRRAEEEWMQPIGLGAVVMLIGSMVHGMVDCTWRDYGQQVLFWSLLGWLAASGEVSEAA